MTKRARVFYYSVWIISTPQEGASVSTKDYWKGERAFQGQIKVWHKGFSQESTRITTANTPIEDT